MEDLPTENGGDDGLGRSIHLLPSIRAIDDM